MKVQPTPDVHGPDRPDGARPDARVQSRQPIDETADRVTIDDSHQLEQLLSDSKLRGDVGRGAQLQQLAGAINKGQYRPDASQLAERILSSAEAEARLLAMLRG